jgi:tetratricopeptide (TPR) repeat protein
MRIILAMLVAALLSAPVAAEWAVAESNQFRVYARGSEENVARRAQLLEQFDQLLRRYTGVPAERAAPKLDVFMLRNSAEVQRLSGRPLIAGIYVASPSGICVFGVDKERGFYATTTLHEYVHHFMLQHAATAYPRWFAEAFAEYFMTAEFAGSVAKIGVLQKGRVRTLQRMDWMAWDDLLRGDVSSEDFWVFYPQSWILLHYIYQDAGRTAQLADYLAAVANGGDPVTAFSAAFSASPEAFGDEVRRYFLEKRIPYRKLTLPPGYFRAAAIETRTLPDSSDDILPRFAMLNCGLGDPQRHLRVIRRNAEDRDDGYARARLAQAEALAGDTAIAIKSLSAMVAAEPDNPDHSYFLGRAYSRRAHEEGFDIDADHKTARTHYARANRLRPNHVPTLFYHVHDGDAYRGESERALMRLALELAPQVVPVATTLALSLALIGEWEEAEAVLAPAANNPHAADDSWSRRLIEHIRARDIDIRYARGGGGSGGGENLGPRER